MNPKHVICLGVATLDQIFEIDVLPAFPAKTTAQRFVVTGGGMAANAAVAVQRLGGRASYWGRMGTDLVGDQVLALLLREGVDVTHVHRIANAPTKANAILIDGRGERLVIRAPNIGYPDDTSWLPLAQVQQADAVHGDSRWPSGSLALFNAAAEHGIPSVFDGDTGETAPMLSCSRAATHPVFGETLYTQLGLGEPAVGLPKLFGGRNRVCGVTCGGKGFYWFDGQALHHTPTPRVKVVDTLGAGDTFHGAYAMALAEGQGLDAAARFASAVAALKCTRFGGREGIPNRAEVEAFLRAN
jgi:sulfofructose kinase